jgi:hypothetical protein
LLDRHAFVVAIGGDAMLDLVGYVVARVALLVEVVREALALHRQDPISQHLEVETYTWGVPPPCYRANSLAPAIAKELQWVRQRFPA